MDIAFQRIYALSDNHHSDEFIHLESRSITPISQLSDLSSLPSTPSILPDYELSRNILIDIPPPDHLISSRYQFPTFLSPIPPVNMNLHNPQHNPLNDMPLRHEKRAPKKFTGKYDEVAQFIKQYKRLINQHQVTSDVDRCEGILEYCSKSVREFIEASLHYINSNWDQLVDEILKYYDAEKDEMRYNLGDFLKFLSFQSKKYITNLEKWKGYYREYMARAGHLRSRNLLSEEEFHGYFWLGLPPSLKEILEERMISRYPTHNTFNPWTIEQTCTVAEAHFKRGKYSERLLQFPTHIAPVDDTDYASESDSENEQYDSDSDSEYERPRRHRSNRKKKQRARKIGDKLKKKLETRQIEEDRSRTISAPQEEIEGIISKLNTMSIEDPMYGQLYYKAVKSDSTGLITQCIYRKPLQENRSSSPSAYAATTNPPPSAYYPSTPSIQPPFQRPAPASYPNSIPIGGQGPLNASPPQAPFRTSYCFGCNDPQHMMRDCPKLAEMLKKGIVYIDANRKYYLRNGRRLFRQYGESFVDCIKRMSSEENPSTVNFVTKGTRKSGEIYRNEPPTDEYWSDTDDHDDGPYRRYGQTVALETCTLPAGVEGVEAKG